MSDLRAGLTRLSETWRAFAVRTREAEGRLPVGVMDETRARMRGLADQSASCADELDALLASPQGEGWQPITEAPEKTDVAVMTRGGSVLRARLDVIENDEWWWIAVNEDEHPPCWTDGTCWGSNAENEPSDPPILWMHLPFFP